MKILFLVLVFFFIFLNVYAQNTNNPIITGKNNRYFQNDQRLTNKQLKLLLGSNPASEADFDRWKKKSDIGTGFLLAGSVLLVAGGAVELSSSIKQTNDINNGTLKSDYPSGLGLIVGALGLEIVAIAFILPARKHLRNSVELYNGSLPTTQHRYKEIHLSLSTNGLGVKMNF